MPSLLNFRPPKSHFEGFEYTWPENGPATSVMAGESAVVAAWIPHSLRQHELPQGFLRQEWAKDASVPALLATGNHKPPPIFEPGEIGFVRYLDSMDFRGAIALLEPTL